MQGAPITHLSDDVLTRIFDLSTYTLYTSDSLTITPPDPFDTPGGKIPSVRPKYTDLITNIGTKRSISLVCKRWHALIIPLLYEVLFVVEGRMDLLRWALVEPTDHPVVSQGTTGPASSAAAVPTHTPKSMIGSYARCLVISSSRRTPFSSLPSSHSLASDDFWAPSTPTPAITISDITAERERTDHTNAWIEIISHIGPSLLVLHSFSNHLSAGDFGEIISGSPNLRTVSVEYAKEPRFTRENSSDRRMSYPHPSVLLQRSPSQAQSLSFVKMTITTHENNAILPLGLDPQPISSLRALHLVWRETDYPRYASETNLQTHCSSLVHFLSIQGPYLRTIYLEGFDKHYTTVLQQILTALDSHCPNLDTLVLLLESWTNVPYDLALPPSVKRLGLRCEMGEIGSVYRLTEALKRAAAITGSNIAEDSIGGLEVVRFFRPKSPSRPRGQSMGQQAENVEKERVKWEGMKTEIDAMCKMSFGDGERGFRVEYVD